MGNQVTGRAYISANGKRLASKEGARLGLGGVDRTAVTGDGGVLGYQESTVVPFVECTIAHKADTNLKDLQGLTDTSVTFETDTGRVYKLVNAWTAKALELDRGDVSLRFEALFCEEM